MHDVGREAIHKLLSILLERIVRTETMSRGTRMVRLHLSLLEVGLVFLSGRQRSTAATASTAGRHGEPRAREISDRYPRLRSPLLGTSDLGVNRPAFDALEEVISLPMLSQAAVLSIELCSCVGLRLSIIIPAIL